MNDAEMMELGKATPLPWQKQIEALIHQRQFQKANKMIFERSQIQADDADLYYLKGVSAYLQGRMAEAIQELRKSLARDPKHTDAAICLSVLYNDLGKYEEGKKVFDMANDSIALKKTGDDTEVDRKFAVKHLELADLYFRYRRYDEAIDEYTKAATLDPTALHIRIRRAKAFAKKGLVTRAIQELIALKELHPRFIPARIQLGLLHYSQGNLLDAELEWEGILPFSSQNREALSYLAMVRKAREKKV
jgi:tetratricopeptide (TPR) repeat protein